MTVKEIRELLNNIDMEYDDCPIVVFQGLRKKEIEKVSKIASPMGKPCCLEIKIEK